MLEQITLTASASLRITICSLVTLLLLTSISFAHNEKDQGNWRDDLHAFKVHQIIEELYDIDAEDVNDVNHDYNNFKASPSTECGYRGGHSGYDVSHEEDEAEIYSLTDGEVIKVKMPKNHEVELSYLVIYNDTHNKTIFYVHLSHIDVEIGDEIEMGDYIGDQGLNSDFSTGYHIHLEVRQNISSAPSCGAGAGGARQNVEPINSIYEIGSEDTQGLGAPALSLRNRILTQTWGSIKFNN